MRSDLVVTIALSFAAAAWVTVHVALSVGLIRRHPRWRGFLGFFVAPLAPLFGFAAKLWIRTALWVFFAVAYAILRIRAYA